MERLARINTGSQREGEYECPQMDSPPQQLGTLFPELLAGLDSHNQGQALADSEGRRMSLGVRSWSCGPRLLHLSSLRGLLPAPGTNIFDQGRQNLAVGCLSQLPLVRPILSWKSTET